MRDRTAELEEMTRWAQEAADEAKARSDFFPFGITVRIDPTLAPGDAYIRIDRHEPEPELVAYLPRDLPTSGPRPLRRPRFGANPLTGTPKPVNPNRRRK